MPSAPQSVQELENQLSSPPADLCERLGRLDGDIMFLGVGGKMGPTMARMARRASDEAGAKRRVIGVSRFSSPQTADRLEDWGVETIACDLLDESQVAELPDAPNIVYMSGFKFGAADNPPLTWAMNCLVPTNVCRRFRTSRITAFSTGNVYGMAPVSGHGSLESDRPDPIGEYAMTALGRERMFQYFSAEFGAPLTLLRLNYATELRYGVLIDMALAVRDQRPINVSMGYANVIWLRDANAMTLRALSLEHEGARTLNLAGAEILRVRDVCTALGKHLGVEPIFEGEESDTALLSDGRAAYADLGQPEASAAEMIRWSAEWVVGGGELLNKPTHFEVRDGKY